MNKSIVFWRLVTCAKQILSRNHFFCCVCIVKLLNEDNTNDLKDTAQKMKFSIKDFFSKCDQICRKIFSWSFLHHVQSVSFFPLKHQHNLRITSIFKTDELSVFLKNMSMILGITCDGTNWTAFLYSVLYCLHKVYIEYCMLTIITS